MSWCGTHCGNVEKRARQRASQVRSKPPTQERPLCPVRKHTKNNNADSQTFKDTVSHHTPLSETLGGDTPLPKGSNFELGGLFCHEWLDLGFLKPYTLVKAPFFESSHGRHICAFELRNFATFFSLCTICALHNFVLFFEQHGFHSHISCFELGNCSKKCQIGFY